MNAGIFSGDTGIGLELDGGLISHKTEGFDPGFKSLKTSTLASNIKMFSDQNQETLFHCEVND